MQVGKKYKIIYDRNGCIGAATCVIASKFFKMNEEDGRADLIEGKKTDQHEVFELEIDEEFLKMALDGAGVCPVNVIHVIDLETGEQII